MSRTSPKQLFGFALVAVSMALLLGNALAQTTTSPLAPPAGEQLGPNDRKDIDNFLINRPDVAKELQSNPSLINNPQWLAQHPEVSHFMSTHPNVEKMAAEHPDWAAKQVQHSVEKQVDRGVGRTDEFLQNHPKVAQELANNPKLIDNKEYLAQHPQLNSYLSSHPEVRSDWQAHPVTFSKAAEAYHQDQVAHNKSTAPHPTSKK